MSSLKHELSTVQLLSSNEAVHLRLPVLLCPSLENLNFTPPLHSHFHSHWAGHLDRHTSLPHDECALQKADMA
jgi:hypothetical protein